MNECSLFENYLSKDNILLLDKVGEISPEFFTFSFIEKELFDFGYFYFLKEENTITLIKLEVVIYEKEKAYHSANVVLNDLNFEFIDTMVSKDVFFAKRWRLNDKIMNKNPLFDTYYGGILGVELFFREKRLLKDTNHENCYELILNIHNYTSTNLLQLLQ